MTSTDSEIRIRIRTKMSQIRNTPVTAIQNTKIYFSPDLTVENNPLEKLVPERGDFRLELHILLLDLHHVVDLLVLVLVTCKQLCSSFLLKNPRKPATFLMN